MRILQGWVVLICMGVFCYILGLLKTNKYKIKFLNYLQSQEKIYSFSQSSIDNTLSCHSVYTMCWLEQRAG